MNQRSAVGLLASFATTLAATLGGAPASAEAIGSAVCMGDHANRTDPTEQYRQDIEELANTIRETHPRPFWFRTQADFDALVAGEIASVDSTWARRDLLWSMGRVIVSIGCGHSQLASYFNQEDSLIEPADRFPADVRLVGDRLFVLDPLINGDQLAVGDEIVGINGRDVADVISDAFDRIPADNGFTAAKRYRFNVYATSYLTYALGFPDSYSVTTSAADQSLPLASLGAFKHKPIVAPTDPCPDTLCYRIDEDSGVPIMRIRSFAFYGQNGSVFANFVADAFEDLADRDARSLIIDVRGNHGGSGLAAAFLLRRLASEPFSYWAPETDSGANDDLFEVQLPVETGFEGDVFLLVNADTFSAVPHFAALAKEHGMATLVGEPMGGGTSTNDAKRSHSSSNHGVNYRVATMRFDIDAPSIGMGASVQPEVLLEATVDDVLLGRDSQLRAAIALAS